MKLSLALSILLHLSILLITLSNKQTTTEQPKSKGNKKIEVSLNYKKDETIVVMETTIKTNKSQKKLDFYYGIGVWTGTNDNFNSYRIDNILQGYPADRSGIRLDDQILLINGEKITYINDLRSSGPKTLVLTILRNGVTFNLTIETAKIFYQ